MLPPTIEAQLFVRDTCQLGEGPFWFEDRLWWVDIDVGLLHSVDATGQNKTSHAMGRRIGAAAPIDGSRFIVALEDGIGIFYRDSGTVEILASPEKGLSGSRFNDGKCDPVGRFVAGTLNMNGKAGTSALYSMDGNGFLQKLFAPVSLSNGLAWSADGRTLYYIDSPTYEIAAFHYDIKAGQIGNRRVVVTIPREMGTPDGMDIDVDGNLWVAHWNGSAVRCWSPLTGQCIAEIRMPSLAPTSCSFGGYGLNQLFITTADVGDTEKGSYAGSIFVCEPGIKGSAVKTFKIYS